MGDARAPDGYFCNGEWVVTEEEENLIEDMKQRGKYACPKTDTTNPKDLLGAKKPPLRLVPPAAIIGLSRVMELGAKKYGPYNWREKKVKLSVYLEAAMRHILSAQDGEELDPESGRPHTEHAMACMAIITDARETGNLIVDLPAPGPAARMIAEMTQKDRSGEDYPPNWKQKA